MWRVAAAPIRHESRPAEAGRPGLNAVMLPSHGAPLVAIALSVVSLVGTSKAASTDGAPISSSLTECLSGEDDVPLSVTLELSLFEHPVLRVRFGAVMPMVVEVELSSPFTVGAGQIPLWGTDFLESDRYGRLFITWGAIGESRLRVSLPARRALADILSSGYRHEVRIRGFPPMIFFVPRDDFRRISEIACPYVVGGAD